MPYPTKETARACFIFMNPEPSATDHRASPNALQHLVEEGIEKSMNAPSTISAATTAESRKTPVKQGASESEIYNRVQDEVPSPQKPLESTLKVIRTPKPIGL